MMKKLYVLFIAVVSMVSAQSLYADETATIAVTNYSKSPVYCAVFAKLGIGKKMLPFDKNVYELSASYYPAAITIPAGSKWVLPGYSREILFSTDQEAVKAATQNPSTSALVGNANNTFSIGTLSGDKFMIYGVDRNGNPWEHGAVLKGAEYSKSIYRQLFEKHDNEGRKKSN